jgi:hypothetical protein
LRRGFVEFTGVGLKIQRFKGSKVQGFKGSKVQRFKTCPLLAVFKHLKNTNDEFQQLPTNCLDFGNLPVGRLVRN